MIISQKRLFLEKGQLNRFALLCDQRIEFVLSMMTTNRSLVIVR